VPKPGQEAEVAELRALLASPLFTRAPSLTQLLRYICQKHFNGESHLIKEQHIAVEALGRQEPFDQKRDSIVRVELHRLRKRLQQYYQTEGAGHGIVLTIPAGGYAPRFIVKTPEPAPPAPQEVSCLESPPLEAIPHKRRFTWRSLAAFFSGLAVLLIVLARLT
jgi:hypothetical protein